MKTDKINFSRIINIFEYKYLIEILIIIVGIILRLKLYFSNPSFFFDECSLGFNIINKSYSELFLPLKLNQCAPPFFLIISKLFLDLSHQQGNLYTQDLVLRAFPLFCSIASLPLFAIFLNKITSNKIFIWVCISMLTFNTCAINYSVQFKQYSCELMFSLILLLIFQCFDINKLSKKTLGLYTFIFCISIWFSNTAFIILATGLLYFFFKSFYYDFRKQINSNLPKISIIATTCALNLGIYYCFYFKAEYNSYIYDFMHTFWQNRVPSFFTFNNFLSLFPNRLQGLIKIPFLPNNSLNLFLLFNIIILFLPKQNFKFKEKFFIIIPILLTIIPSFLNIYPFERKLILFSLPLFILLYCQILNFIQPDKIFKILTILCLSLLSVIKLNTPIEAYYYDLFKQPVRNSVEFIIQNKISTPKIIVMATDEIYYYVNSDFDKNQLFIYDSYWDKNSRIPQFLKTNKNGDYYIFAPYYKWHSEYYKNIISYLNSDAHFKILNKYTYNDFVYIIHFEKR